MNPRTRPHRWNALSRSFLGVCTASILALASGCMSPVTVDLDEQPSVSQSEAKRDLGIDYLSSGRTAMAIRQLQASLELDADDAQTHLWLGEAYRRKGQAKKAEVFLLDSVKIATRHRDDSTIHAARLNLSALLSQMGRFEEALEYCEALSVDPTFSTPWRPITNCGWALMQLGRLDEARTHFMEALDFFPRYGPALLNLGILESKQGHRVAAIASLQKAIDSKRLGASGLAEANFRLGEIYVALGRRDKAVAHFSEAVDTAPDVDWGSQSQAYLDLLR